ncbi:hypothetical protein HY256_08075 [Candidatus Sumerlaeota bacterium]|nr:hypothetical protein [Candidatus Sumerlaeota bacterium]
MKSPTRNTLPFIRRAGGCAAALLALLAGCATAPEIGPDHPANPTATAGPAGTESTALQSDAPGKAVPQAAQGEVYTCPMHPEVIQPKPGKCPKCGMTLVKKKKEEPKAKEGHEQHEHH